VAGRHETQLVKLHSRWHNMLGRSPAEVAIIMRAWHFHDRQLALFHARQSAAQRLRAGQPIQAARFLGGGVRIALTSLIKMGC